MNNFLYYLRKFQRYLPLPFWLLYRIHYHAQNSTLPKGNGRQSTSAKRPAKEDVLHTILSKSRNKSLLEIGIGQFPNVERVKIINSRNISYTGLDFDFVCRDHKAELRHRAVSLKHIRYLPNKKGTYAWTLFKLLENKEQFDIIYLDGHHTFYIDLPAFFLTHLLLKKVGLLIVDDICWTLSFLQKNMAVSYLDWYFYRKMYDFSQYDFRQQNMPHIKMITEEIMIKRYGYRKLKQYQTEDSWVLIKRN